MSAEIGTMRVTDQIDALSTLSTNPIKYLVTPRLVAGTLALPFLVLVADILGVLGGFTVCVMKLDFSASAYIAATIASLKVMDVTVGLVKAAIFGFLIALMGCYHAITAVAGPKAWGPRRRRRWSPPPSCCSPSITS